MLHDLRRTRSANILEQPPCLTCSSPPKHLLRTRARAPMMALLLPISLGLVARAPGRCPAARMGSRLDGMVLGEAVPPEVLQQLGVDGKRAVVAFFCRDNGHECMQELRDLESRATRYRADFSCDIVAIRSRGSWVNEDTASKYPSLRFMCAWPHGPHGPDRARHSSACCVWQCRRGRGAPAGVSHGDWPD